MHRRRLLSQLERYVARLPGDASRAAEIRRFVERHPDCFHRTCLEGHVTGSAWIVSRDGDRVVLVRHRKLGAWLQPGGHADGDPDVARVAWREAAEESGLTSLALVDWAGGTDSGGGRHGAASDPARHEEWSAGGGDGSQDALPFDVDVHRIPARAGEPEHLHLDLRFLFVADGSETPRGGHESDEVRWVELRELRSFCGEPGLLRMAAKAMRLLPTNAHGPGLPEADGTLREDGASLVSLSMIDDTTNASPELDPGALELARALDHRVEDVARAWREATARRAACAEALAGAGAPPASGDPRVAVVRAMMASLLEPGATEATAALERELGSLVRVRRSAGGSTRELVDELGLLHEATVQALGAVVAARDQPPRPAAILGIANRLGAAHVAVLGTALRLVEREVGANREGCSALLGTFARSATHELRNRVNATRLSLSVLRAGRDDRRDELLENLDESVKRLEDAVADVFAVALAQSQELPTDGSISLQRLLARMRADFDELAVASKVAVRVIQPVPDLVVDASRVQLALLNLVASAVKRSDRSRSDRWVEIAVGAGDAGQWRVEVRDNGMAFAPGVEQAQAVGGAGIGHAERRRVAHSVGLAIAVEVVRQLGGRIWFDQRAGGGTTSCFTIPRGGAEVVPDCTASI